MIGETNVILSGMPLLNSIENWGISSTTSSRNGEVYKTFSYAMFIYCYGYFLRYMDFVELSDEHLGNFENIVDNHGTVRQSHL